MTPPKSPSRRKRLVAEASAMDDKNRGTMRLAVVVSLPKKATVSSVTVNSARLVAATKEHGPQVHLDVTVRAKSSGLKAGPRSIGDSHESWHGSSGDTGFPP